MFNEILKILRDIFKGRLLWNEIRDFMYWFLFNQGQKESSNGFSDEHPAELPRAIKR